MSIYTMKLTKIIATLGPASETKEIISELVEQGVNVFRFNLKHNELSWHKQLIYIAQEISKNLDIPIGILLDLQGPELRISIPNGSFECKKNDIVLITQHPVASKKEFALSHQNIFEFVTIGQRVVIDDGAFEFTISGKQKDSITLTSHSTGLLKTNKSLNIPDGSFPLPTLTDKDRLALVLAKEVKADFIALSFVRRANDIKELRNEMEKINLKSQIVAKIEAKEALNNLDEIIELSDAVMVARGDLGIEIPLEQVPYYQKTIIEKCQEKGIPVITATQMLESMIEHPMATRAEISDIANAVYDFTDAVMLSGETASGKYPLQTVETMRKTVQFTEKKTIDDIRPLCKFHILSSSDMICDAAYNLYLQLMHTKEKPTGFMVFTHTGRTAKKLSRYRPKIPVFAFSPDPSVIQQLTLSFGVAPFLHDNIEKNEIVRSDIYESVNVLVKKNLVKKGDVFIVIHGDYWTVAGGTSTIRIVTV